MGISKFSASSGFGNKTRYASMLAGNATYFPLVGAYESIASLSGTGSSSSVTFTSIPQGYTHLQLRGIVRSAGVSSQIYTRLNGDGGSNYNCHYLYADGSGGIIGGTGGAPTTVNLFGSMLASTDTANVYASFVLDFLDYSVTTKHKTSMNFFGQDLNGGANGVVWASSSAWRNTAAVTSLTVVANANFTADSKFYLYGIRGK